MYHVVVKYITRYNYKIIRNATTPSSAIKITMKSVKKRANYKLLVVNRYVNR